MSGAKVFQLCPTLCDPTDCSLLGFSVIKILQARILEWVPIFFSGRSSQPRDQTQVSCVSCVGRLILYHCAPPHTPQQTPRAVKN